VVKQLTIELRSVKIDMIRAILPKVQLPILSNKGGRLKRCKGSFNQLTGKSFEVSSIEKLIICYNKIIIKVMSVQSKSIHSLCWERTTVSTKGSNSYVGGGPLLAGLRLKSPIYSVLKDTARRRGPVYIQSRNNSTSTGRTTNVLKKLDDLHNRSKSTNKVIDRKLYKDFLLEKDMYLAAYQRLRSKPGMMTPGIDPTTLDGLSPTVIQEIISKLSTGEFKFTPGRRIEIPKGNGKTRPLVIGNPRDKLVQEVMRMVLEAIYEPIFKDVSHGFRPKRSCHTALRTIFTSFVGCTW
jgi:hypothetical protein